MVKAQEDKNGIKMNQKKNIGILTHYDVNNLGAQLQLYALYNQLMGMGYSPYVLTYFKNYDFAYEEKLKNQISIKSVPYLFKHYFFKKGMRLTFFNVEKYMHIKKFRDKNFRYKFYTSPSIDCVIIGSDEVFSIPVGVNIMMYGHGLSTNKAFSYAPSFGQTNIELLKKRNCENLVSSGIKNLLANSARDEHTANLIKTFTGKDIPIVCDPAILFNFANTKSGIKKYNVKYLLVYSYDRWMVERSEIAAIKTYAKKKGLKILSVGTYHKWCDKNIVCNCIEWIDYFRYAEGVVTDTFHGLILSIIAQKKVGVYVREENKNKLTDLLCKAKLSEQRMNEISTDELERVLEHEIDYDIVNKEISELREESLKFLEASLDLCFKH